MSKILILTIITLTFIISGCNNTIELSEKIDIKTTRDSMDIDYQNVSEKVFQIDQQQLKEKTFAEYPDVNKDYIKRFDIKIVKEIKSLKKEINNIEKNSEKSGIYVEITMNYEKLKPDQARQIIKYYRTLIMDELTKLVIKI